MRILPYKMLSSSAKALAQELGVQRVRHDGKFRNNHNHLIVNWGSSRMPEFRVDRFLNHPMSVRRASCKHASFISLEEAGVSIPEWTTDSQTALGWINNGEAVVARKVLNGHSGRGIVLCDPKLDPLECTDTHRSSLISAPLYVKYVKKQDEYRYHVFNNEVIDIQMKKKRQETPNEEVNYQIRNHSNGFIYARDGINPPISLQRLACDAVRALNLHFGAVDIIWNARKEQGYVLEVNTACGLEGQTLSSYADAIRRVA